MPPPLTQFIAEHPDLDYDQSQNEIFLYHGTNCYRRWEINHTGAIETGQGNYSFFSARPHEAYQYARKAALRDMNLKAINSLTSEAVVLKVRFNARSWLQVDSVREPNVLDADGKIMGFTIAVLGPISFSNIVDVLYCTHNRRLTSTTESVRSFENGTLIRGIRHLRFKLMERRPDAWLLKQLGRLTRKVEVELAGGEVPDLTLQDDLRRLKQFQMNML